MEPAKPKARRIETEEQRSERLLALAAESERERRAEEDSLDAMVRRSIALHGAQELPRVVAVALLTDSELRTLGKAFDRAWPIEQAPTAFDELLKAIDAADRQLQDRKPSL